MSQRWTAVGRFTLPEHFARQPDWDASGVTCAYDIGRIAKLRITFFFAGRPIDVRSAAPPPAKQDVARAWRSPTSVGVLSLLRLICFGCPQVSSSLSNNSCRYLMSSRSLGRAAFRFMAIKSLIAQTGTTIPPRSKRVINIKTLIVAPSTNFARLRLATS